MCTATRSVLLFVILILPMLGCEQQQLQRAADEVAAARADLQQLAAALQQTAGADKDLTPAQAEQLASVRQAISDALAKADQAAEAGAVALQAAAQAADEDDPGKVITAGGASVAAMLPPPYQQWALLGTTLAGALVSILYRRSAKEAQVAAEQTSEAAKAIARAIEKAKDANGQVNFDDPAVKRQLRAEMGAAADQLVDAGRGKA